MVAQQEPAYVSGKIDGLAGKPGPAFSKPDHSWAERLYARGWSDGADERALNIAIDEARINASLLRPLE